jgi:protein involved in sex pheromone biosynthesis
MYTLYVGSPNDTNELNLDLLKSIKAIVSKYFESYTYVKGRGVFKDTEEDMMMITIANAEKGEVYKLGEELRTLLKQDGVGIEHNGVYEKLITKK